MCKHMEAPEIAKKYGMTRLVFEDDFESMDTIDLGATGEEGYKWYPGSRNRLQKPTGSYRAAWRFPVLQCVFAWFYLLVVL